MDTPTGVPADRCITGIYSVFMTFLRLLFHSMNNSLQNFISFVFNEIYNMRRLRGRLETFFIILHIILSHLLLLHVRQVELLEII